MNSVWQQSSTKQRAALAGSETDGILKANLSRTARFGIGTKLTRSATQNGTAALTDVGSKFSPNKTAFYA